MAFFKGAEDERGDFSGVSTGPPGSFCPLVSSCGDAGRGDDIAAAAFEVDPLRERAFPKVCVALSDGFWTRIVIMRSAPSCRTVQGMEPTIAMDGDESVEAIGASVSGVDVEDVYASGGSLIASGAPPCSDSDVVVGVCFPPPADLTRLCGSVIEASWCCRRFC